MNFLVFLVFFIVGVVGAFVWAAINVTRRQEGEEKEEKEITFGDARGPLMFFGATILMYIGWYSMGLPLLTESWWFDNLGYLGRFWIERKAGWTLFGIFFASGLFVFWLNNRISFGRVREVISSKLSKAEDEDDEETVYSSSHREALEETEENTGFTYFIVNIIAFIVALFGMGALGKTSWQTVMLFFNKVPSGTVEPMFHNDVSFYLFSLPFWHLISSTLLLFLGLSAVWSMIVYGVARTTREGRLTRETLGKISGKWFGHMTTLGALFVLVLTWKLNLARLGLVYSGRGSVVGASHTDVFVQNPAYFILMGIFLIFAGWIYWYGNMRKKRPTDVSSRTFSVPVVLFVAFLGFFVIWPAAHQAFMVKPQEVTRERPYLKRNINLTRSAYNLDKVNAKQYDVKTGISQEKLGEHSQTLNNIRLWDWRAAIKTLDQMQALRLYHGFNDVDIDRYTLDGELREVMLSPREIYKDRLKERSQNFVNRKVVYTHGYGLTTFDVNKFTSGGRPDLLTKDMPPQSKYPELQVDKPQVYYGQVDNSYVLVNSTEKEFDYPKGDDNVYTNYKGEGGVGFHGLGRKFLFATKFGGNWNLLLTSYSKKGTNIMFDREITNRIKKIAPFLTLDGDPYLVVSDDGRMKWVQDAYTTSNMYPYSEKYKETTFLEDSSPVDFPSRYKGINYIRNSVKVVVDAYDGSVDFYKFENGPIIETWQNVFPDMFKSKDEAPQWLMEHIRYPEDYLTIQSRVYGIYHMQDPKVFFGREDAWKIATEKFYQQSQEVQPYYVITQLPDKKKPEFVQIVPFTPKSEKDNMIGWAAGRCDGKKYGEMLAYKLPKGGLVYGPRQIESRIDQNDKMSQRFSLWSQRGSKVIRGNLLTIPIGGTMFYFEPVFLEAEDSEFPELKRVIVAMGDSDVYWGESLGEAIENLYAGKIPEEIKKKKVAGTDKSVEELIKSTADSFERYEKLTSEGKHEKAGKVLAQLKKDLKKLNKLIGADEETPKEESKT